MKNKYKILIVLLVAAVAVIVVAAFVLLGGKKTKATVNDTQSAQNENYVSYNGKKYRKKDNIRTYLFMGIDKDGTVAEAEDAVSGGQSDAMFLIIIDMKEKNMSILSINRNTMTDIDIYDKDDNFLETKEMQICLQHGFGDGMRTSCQRSVEAVSNLLYGQSIDGYLAMNMDGMIQLNDAVGGVTLEVMDDLTDASRGVNLTKGETVTLSGSEAYVYLRSRDINEFDSASQRLNRQMQYIQAFIKQIKEEASGSPDKLISAYNSIQDYIITNTDIPGLIKKGMKYGYSESDMYTIPGETQMGDVYEEYIVDQDALYELVLDLFYEEVD